MDKGIAKRINITYALIYYSRNVVLLTQRIKLLLQQVLWLVMNHTGPQHTSIFSRKFVISGKNIQRLICVHYNARVIRFSVNAVNISNPKGLSLVTEIWTSISKTVLVVVVSLPNWPIIRNRLVKIKSPQQQIHAIKAQILLHRERVNVCSLLEIKVRVFIANVFCIHV